MGTTRENAGPQQHVLTQSVQGHWWDDGIPPLTVETYVGWPALTTYAHRVQEYRRWSRRREGCCRAPDPYSRTSGVFFVA